MTPPSYINILIVCNEFCGKGERMLCHFICQLFAKDRPRTTHLNPSPELWESIACILFSSVGICFKISVLYNSSFKCGDQEHPSPFMCWATNPPGSRLTAAAEQSAVMRVRTKTSIKTRIQFSKCSPTPSPGQR